MPYIKDNKPIITDEMLEKAKKNAPKTLDAVKKADTWLADFYQSITSELTKTVKYSITWSFPKLNASLYGDGNVISNTETYAQVESDNDFGEYAIVGFTFPKVFRKRLMQKVNETQNYYYPEDMNYHRIREERCLSSQACKERMKALVNGESVNDAKATDRNMLLMCIDDFFSKGCPPFGHSKDYDIQLKFIHNKQVKLRDLLEKGYYDVAYLQRRKEIILKVAKFNGTYWRSRGLLTGKRLRMLFRDLDIKSIKSNMPKEEQEIAFLQWLFHSHYTNDAIGNIKGWSYSDLKQALQGNSVDILAKALND
jgi:hypothetical protein